MHCKSRDLNMPSFLPRPLKTAHFSLSCPTRQRYKTPRFCRSRRHRGARASPAGSALSRLLLLVGLEGGGKGQPGTMGDYNFGEEIKPPQISPGMGG